MSIELSPSLKLACALTFTDAEALSQCGKYARLGVYWQLFISSIQFCIIAGFTFFSIYSTFDSAGWALTASIIVGIGIVVLDLAILSSLIKSPISKTDIKDNLKQWIVFLVRFCISLIFAYAIGSTVETMYFEDRINQVIHERDMKANQEIIQTATKEYESHRGNIQNLRNLSLDNLNALNASIYRSTNAIEALQKEIDQLSSDISSNKITETKELQGWDGDKEIPHGEGKKSRVAAGNVKAFTEEREAKNRSLTKLIDARENDLSRQQVIKQEIDDMDQELKSLSQDSYVEGAIKVAKDSNQWTVSSQSDHLLKREVFSELIQASKPLFIYALVIKLSVMVLECITLISHIFIRPTEYASKLLVLEKIRFKQALLDCEYQMAKLATEHSSKMEDLGIFSSKINSASYKQAFPTKNN